MKPEDQQRMENLCTQIAVEQDPNRFLTLVRRLNDLLEHSQNQLLGTDGSRAGQETDGSGAGQAMDGSHPDGSHAGKNTRERREQNT